MTYKQYSDLQRLIGKIEGLAYGVDDKIVSNGLFDTVIDIDEKIQEIQIDDQT